MPHPAEAWPQRPAGTGHRWSAGSSSAATSGDAAGAAGGAQPSRICTSLRPLDAARAGAQPTGTAADGMASLQRWSPFRGHPGVDSAPQVGAGRSW